MTSIQEQTGVLRKQAEEQCEGCRLSWQIDPATGRHKEPMPIECEAPEIRRQIRELNSNRK